MEQTTGANVARDLTDWLNGATKAQKKDFINYIVCHTHRTIQQRFMALIVDLIEEWAQLPPGGYDTRNEATHTLCKEIVTEVEFKYFKLPVI